ncbi:DMT family transporter [Insolitispirillum peregrinum]|uniref:Threonine/homoserine efflux transporter RhtA n=1 Tax=Insolitispirillum peregrinum TaxID=80876 RepID=A0A1N7LF62_9PROT|nr:DMT family transporter [Insolitispirillum peregrinum]SIS72465.1 Threonine/homoserine efflux transporter RhtA [Insolitispirillum peregrinum]
MSRMTANLLLLLTAFIWGTAFVAQKLAFVGADGTAQLHNGVGPLTFTGTRFLIGALVVAPFAWREGRQQGGSFSVGDWLGFAVCGLALFAGSYAQQVGIILTTVSNAGFLTALYVPIVPVLALLVFKKRPYWVVWPAAACTAFGAFLLNNASLTAFGTGDLWVLVGALFWGCHVTVVGIVAARTQSPLRLAVSQFALAGVLGIVSGAIIEAPTLAAFQASTFELAYTGLLSVGVAFTLQVVGQSHTHPAAAAIILSSEMLFAAIAAAIVLGERMNGLQISGAALILGGIMAVEVMPLLMRRLKPL